MENLSAILILVIFVAILGHILYMLFFRKKIPMFTTETFSQQRLKDEKSEYSSEAENQEAEQLLESVYESWSVVETTEDDVLRAPLKYKQVKGTATLLNAVIALAPTDEAVVERFNELADVLNDGNKRKFNGSKTLIISALVIFVLISLISGTWSGALFFVGSIVFYILASMTPMFVINRKEVNGQGGKRSFMTSLIGGLFGTIATAKTYKYVNKNTGEVVDTDNSETWMSMIFTFIVLCFLSFLIGAIALINYIRNYWLHI